MKSGTERLNVLIILIAMCFPSAIALADEGAHKNASGDMTDSVSYSRRLIHRLGFDVRPTYIFPTNSFLKGENTEMEPVCLCTFKILVPILSEQLHRPDLQRLLPRYRIIGILVPE